VKNICLIILILLFVTSITTKLFGQNCTIINKTILFAKGEISILPDSIIIFENESDLDQHENYSVIEKEKGNHFKITYWIMELGGIVDPTFYRKDLVIKQVGEVIKMKFGSLTASYECQKQLDNKKGIVILVKINNR